VTLSNRSWPATTSIPFGTDIPLTAYTIPDPEMLRYEIAASHERRRRYGIDPMDRCNSDQVRLSPLELKARLDHNRRFLKVVTQQTQELYQLVAGAGFAVVLADPAMCLTGYENEALVKAAA
jgi:transcriptional regulator of acetoin/glycerol metabolism